MDDFIADVLESVATALACVPPEEKCFSCEKVTSEGEWDEGDLWYCDACIKAWEIENKADWSTGQPKQP